MVGDDSGMGSPCEDCGGATTSTRSRFEIRLPQGGWLIADEVPALRCEACGRTDPAKHVRPQMEGVIELALDLPGARVHKDFTSAPLVPHDA